MRLIEPTTGLILTAQLLGAICSSVLIAYDGIFWKQELLGYVPWALMPYAVLLAAHLFSRWLRVHPPIYRTLTCAIVVVATLGPVLYVDTLFIHVDAQGAIAMLMVPIVQTALILLVTAVCFAWKMRREFRRV